VSAPSYEIAFTPQFWASLDSLEDKARKHAREAIDELALGHASVEVHELQGVPFVSPPSTPA
jgi:hypothetical protein